MDSSDNNHNEKKKVKIKNLSENAKYTTWKFIKAIIAIMKKR